MRFTYASIKQTLTDTFFEKSGLIKTVVNSGVYSFLFDVVAFVMEKIAYYVEVRSRESVYKTAQFRESLIPMCYMLGYIPHRRIGASGSIILSPFPIKETAEEIYTGVDIIIPKWTPFTDENNTVQVYTTEKRIFYKNTKVVYKPIDTSENFLAIGQGRVRFRVPTHGIAYGTSITIIGTKNYDGEYTNLNNDPNPVTLANYIIIESPYYVETPNVNSKILSGHLIIPVKEGIPKQFTYVSSGAANEVAPLYTSLSDNTDLDISLIDDEENVTDIVQKTSEIFLIEDISKYYCEVSNSSDYTYLNLQFGNGITSRKLLAGQRVLIEYAETKGAEGNILGSGMITKNSSPIFDANENVFVPSVLNITPIIGGKDLESLESIRAKAKNIFSAGFRGASKTDWKALLESIPSVLKAVAWAEYELTENTSEINGAIVHVGAINVGQKNPSLQEQAQFILQYLNPQKSITDIIQWERINIVNFRFFVDAKVEGDSFPNIQSQIQAALIDHYDILKNDFNKSIYHSNYTATIDELDTVLYHETYVEVIERSTNFPIILPSTAKKIAISKTIADEPDPLKQIYLQPLSMKVYLRRKIEGEWQARKLIGQAAIGDIISGANGYTTTGSFTYPLNEFFCTIPELVLDDIPNTEPDFGDPGATFGVLNPSVDDANGYTIDFQYKTVDGNAEQEKNLRLASNTDILAFDPEDIEYVLSY